jgi:hypothetical protein
LARDQSRRFGIVSCVKRSSIDLGFYFPIYKELWLSRLWMDRIYSNANFCAYLRVDDGACFKTVLSLITGIEPSIAAITLRIEIHCQCPVELAVARFQQRVRHPGHLDSLRTKDELFLQFEETNSFGPLIPEKAIIFKTEFAPHPDQIIALARRASSMPEKEHQR